MSSRTAAATIACAAAFTLGSAGTALAIPLEPAITTDVTAPAGTDDIVGVGGTGSASLSADPGSAQAAVTGSSSGSGGTGSGGSGSGGGVPGSGSASLGNKISQMGPAIANGIDQLMRALGFRPGPLPACPEGLERTGDGIACR
ncbi:hypothetical protein [Nocardia crassostreae]|uniref:hypothetical protein n=1 Tax=Nocardia crassostreae TaxID=53428 RepID=UPI0012FA7C0A|nr:hypothetical protein [Nocardia crassostreae]